MGAPLAADANASLVSAVADGGFAFVGQDVMRQALTRVGPLTDWEAFSASWNRLGLDGYMADGGRYRRRRYGVYRAAASGPITREAHQPHRQSLDYNPLHGDVDRWFDPIEPSIGAGETMSTALAFCRSFFGALAPETRQWHIEVHQFRIEARAEEPGRPTPEGLHRDGVDYVLVLLINRHNIGSGTTTVHDLKGRALGSFTLTNPFDAALLDDRRVAHGVTPVQPLDPAADAFRDVLVVTLTGQPV